MTDQVLRELSPRFTKMYSDMGRPSIPPEQLLRALLLQGLYTIRSERLLMEEIDYSILFRWFIGLSLDEPIWSPTTFSKNRDRLLKADVASAFFDAVVDQAREAGLMSDEHFTVDGTVLEAWASLKSFQRKDAGPTPPPDDPGQSDGQFPRGDAEERHACVDDGPRRAAVSQGPGQRSEARVSRARAARQPSRPGGECVCHGRDGHRRMGGGAADARSRRPTRRPSAGDKHFDVGRFVTPTRQLGITPHVAQKDAGSRIDGRTTRHPGYAISQRKRKLIEQVFGWMKTIGGLRKLRHRGGELSIGSSPSPRRPTTWSGCAHCWRGPHECGVTPAGRPSGRH